MKSSTLYNVTDIEFDFDDGIKLDDSKLTFDEERDIHDLSLGVWEANDENDLLDEITAATGWTISKIDYEIQLKGDF
tara:strand:+ start:155 stop:385 length:231 start_codon:yes stop_codon:yes gene_type:complete